MQAVRDHLVADELFEDETFEKLDLNRVDLSGKEFHRCTFRGCKLQESVWAASRLEDCAFVGCDLTRLRPGRLLLRGVEFKDSKLMGIDLTGLGAMPSVGFTDCSMRYVAFVSLKLRATAFVRCAIVEANFVTTDLAKSTFADCDLSSTRFEGCDLQGVDFSTCRGLGFEPAKNRIKATRVPLETAVQIASSLGLLVSGFAARDDP